MACDVTYEDVAEPRRKDMQKSSSMGTALKPHVSKLFMHSWPELHGYRQLVCDFSCKDLTYPKDVVDSFSGVTTLLSDVFYGGFLYGLPGGQSRTHTSPWCLLGTLYSLLYRYQRSTVSLACTMTGVAIVMLVVEIFRGG